MASETMNKSINDDPKIVGERIRRKRKELQLSRDELAEKIGVKIGSIETIENGRRYPSISQVLLLCPIIGMSPNMLLTGNDEYDPVDYGFGSNDGFLDKMAKDMANFLIIQSSLTSLDPGTGKLIANLVKELARSRLPDGELADFDNSLALMGKIDSKSMVKGIIETVVSNGESGGQLSISEMMHPMMNEIKKVSD